MPESMLEGVHGVKPGEKPTLGEDSEKVEGVHELSRFRLEKG